MAATNTQVQAFCDNFMRPHCEALRAVYLTAKNNKAIIDDVYANVSDGGSTFADSRTDSPPHLLTKNDVLAYNTALDALIAVFEGGATTVMDDFSAQYPVIQDACVRAV